jgi:hypothetical protein
MSDESVLSSEEFVSAVEMLRQLLPDEELNRRQSFGSATVYTMMVTLWMMTLQRLGGDQTLHAIVKDVLSHNRELLPATNQHGESVWPVALLLVAHELQSSCALPPEIGAMYGEHNTSEAKLARKIAQRMPRGSIAMADSAYGIFSVAHTMVQEGHSILFRLTKSRLKSLKRQATQVEEWDGHATWRLRWMPSPKDRKTNPDLPEDAAIDMLLHEVPLDGETLPLVTTLPVSCERAGEFYARRYDVEHDIRDVKVTLDTENIRGKSESMVKKELLTPIVAYNLVIQFRRQTGRPSATPLELHRRVEHIRKLSADSAGLQRLGMDGALRSGTEDRRTRQVAEPPRPQLSSPCSSPSPKSTKFMKQEAEKTKTKIHHPKSQSECHWALARRLTSLQSIICETLPTRETPECRPRRLRQSSSADGRRRRQQWRRSLQLLLRRSLPTVPDLSDHAWHRAARSPETQPARRPFQIPERVPASVWFSNSPRPHCPAESSSNFRTAD